jgi:ABC-type Na+ efflux pump permease subunit
VINALFALRAFGFLIANIKVQFQKLTSLTPFFFYPFPPLPYLFHPPSFLSLSLISLHPFHMCSVASLSF